MLVHEKTSQKFLVRRLAPLASPVAEPPRDLIGTRIADYDIVARLGEGGMGEVYRARDRKLGREVAIKVLPAEVANDHERLKRFEREARLLATINHASIGAIYGLVEGDGVRALVLELIEGETLSAALERGPLKLQRALALAAQIRRRARSRAPSRHHASRSEAVEHHARRRRRSSCSISASASGRHSVADVAHTRASTLTNEGAIVGTLHYMSPEQLEGRATDARSDIFSFGAVLYEMVAGTKAFDGKSQAGVIAAVLEAPAPKLPGIGGAIGPRLDRIVTKCLAKHPDDRWQSAHDLADELRWLMAEAGPGAPPWRTSIPATSRRRRTTVIVVSAALVALALGWTNWRQADSDTLDTPIRFTVQPQDGRLNDGGFDIAQAGDQLVYSVSSSTPGSRLHVRRFDQPEGLPLNGSAGGGNPVFSPDGQWVAFYSNRALRRVRVGGDASPVVVSDEIGLGIPVLWPTTDTIFTAGRNQPIRRISASGGRTEDVTTLQPETEVDHHTPELLPSGRALLFAVHGKRNRFSIAVQDLRTGERRTVIESGFAPRYSPTGHLLFGRGSAVMAVRFDERSLRVSGDPVTLVEQVGADPRSGVSRVPPLEKWHAGHSTADVAEGPATCLGGPHGKRNGRADFRAGDRSTPDLSGRQTGGLCR